MIHRCVALRCACCWVKAQPAAAASACRESSRPLCLCGSPPLPLPLPLWPPSPRTCNLVILPSTAASHHHPHHPSSSSSSSYYSTPPIIIIASSLPHPSLSYRLLLTAPWLAARKDSPCPSPPYAIILSIVASPLLLWSSLSQPHPSTCDPSQRPTVDSPVYRPSVRPVTASPNRLRPPP